MALRYEAASLLASLARPAVANASTSAPQPRRPASRRSYSAAGTAVVRRSEPADDDGALVARFLRPEPGRPAASGDDPTTSSSVNEPSSSTPQSILASASSRAHPPAFPTLPESPSPDELAYPLTTPGSRQPLPSSSKLRWPELDHLPGLSRPGSGSLTDPKGSSTVPNEASKGTLTDEELYPAPTLALARRLSTEATSSSDIEYLLEADLQARREGLPLRAELVRACDRLIIFTCERHRLKSDGSLSGCDDFDLAWREERLAMHTMPLRPPRTLSKDELYPPATLILARRLALEADNFEDIEKQLRADYQPRLRHANSNTLQQLSDAYKRLSHFTWQRRRSLLKGLSLEHDFDVAWRAELAKSSSTSWNSELFPASTLKLARRLFHKASSPKDIQAAIRADFASRKEAFNGSAAEFGAACDLLKSFVCTLREKGRLGTSLSQAAFQDAWRHHLDLSKGRFRRKLTAPEIPKPPSQTARPSKTPTLVPAAATGSTATKRSPPIPPPATLQSLSTAASTAPRLGVIPARTPLPTSEAPKSQWRLNSPAAAGKTTPSTATALHSAAKMGPRTRPSTVHEKTLASAPTAAITPAPAPPMPTLESTMSSLQHLIDVYSSSLAPFSAVPHSPAVLSSGMSFPEALEARQRQAKVQQAKDVLELTRQALKSMFPDTTAAATSATTAARQLLSPQFATPGLKQNAQLTRSPSQAPPSASASAPGIIKSPKAKRKKGGAKQAKASPSFGLAQGTSTAGSSSAPKRQPEATFKLPTRASDAALVIAPPRTTRTDPSRKSLSAPGTSSADAGPLQSTTTVELSALSAPAGPPPTSSLSEAAVAPSSVPVATDSSTAVKSSRATDSRPVAEPLLASEPPSAIKPASTSLSPSTPPQKQQKVLTKKGSAPSMTRPLSTAVPAHRKPSAETVARERSPPPGPPRRDLTQTFDWRRGAAYRRLAVLTDGNNVAPPRALMTFPKVSPASSQIPVTGAVPEAESTLVRETRVALQQHGKSTLSKRRKPNTGMLAAADAASAIAPSEQSSPGTPVIVRSQIARAPAIVEPLRPSPPPPPPVQLAVAEPGPSVPTGQTVLDALTPHQVYAIEELTRPNLSVTPDNAHTDEPPPAPIVKQVREATELRDLMELVQSLEKTPERSDPVETGTFWSDLIRKSRLLNKLDTAALPMLKADLLRVEPPSSTDKAVLREVLYDILLPIAQKQAGREIKAFNYRPLPLTCRTLRLFLNAAPADPVICALVLKGFAMLGADGAQDFHELEEVVLTRSASAPFEPIPTSGPKRRAAQATWALEALDSIRPFVHPRVLRCWTGVIDTDDLHSHRRRLISIVELFKPELQDKPSSPDHPSLKQAKPSSLSNVPAFPLPTAMPPAIRLIDAYVEASLNNPAVARDPFARYLAWRAWTQAKPLSDAAHVLDSAVSRFGPLKPLEEAERPLETHLAWALQDVNEYGRSLGYKKVVSRGLLLTTLSRLAEGGPLRVVKHRPDWPRSA